MPGTDAALAVVFNGKVKIDDYKIGMIQRLASCPQGSTLKKPSQHFLGLCKDTALKGGADNLQDVVQEIADGVFKFKFTRKRISSDLIGDNKMVPLGTPQTVILALGKSISSSTHPKSIVLTPICR